MNERDMQETDGTDDELRPGEFWTLKLYVAGQSPRSLAAFANLKRLCTEHLPGQVHDRGDRPARAPAARGRRPDRGDPDPDPASCRRRSGRSSGTSRTRTGCWSASTSARRRPDATGGVKTTDGRGDGGPGDDGGTTHASLLRLSPEEAGETLDAIRLGQVDAFLIATPEGDRVYTLQGSEHPYLIYVRSMSEGAVTTAPDGTILFANDRFAELAGAPCNRLVGTPFARYVCPGDLDRVEALMRSGAGDRSRGEVELCPEGGGSVPVYLSVSPYVSGDVAGFCIVVTDLSEQKRTAALVESQHLTQSILERAGDAIVVLDIDGRIVLANHAAVQLAGGNPLLRPFGEVFPLDPAGPDGAATARRLRWHPRPRRRRRPGRVHPPAVDGDAPHPARERRIRARPLRRAGRLRPLHDRHHGPERERAAAHAGARRRGQFEPRAPAVRIHRQPRPPGAPADGHEPTSSSSSGGTATSSTGTRRSSSGSRSRAPSGCSSRSWTCSPTRG